jgi:hypothetical protein
MLTTVAAEYTRVLGPYDIRTLNSRRDLAYWTGRAGIAEAVRLFTEVAESRASALGVEHAATVRSRGELARWTKLLNDLDL